MEEKRYFPEMDRLRGIAMLMVLLYHSIIVYPVNLTEYAWCGMLHSFLWFVEMPLFFLVSGFCFRYDGHYGAYLKKKVLRILVPHVIFGLLDLLPRIIPNDLVHENYDLGQAWKEFFLYGANDWFLWSLFLIFLAAPLLYYVMRNGLIGKIVVVAAAFVLFLTQNIMTPFLSLKNVVQFLLYFVIGMLWRECIDGRGKRERSADQKKRIGGWVCGILCAGLGGFCFYLLQWKGWTGSEEIWAKTLGGILLPLREILIFRVYSGITLLKICSLIVTLVSVLLLAGAFYLAACGLRMQSVNGFLKLCSNYSLQMYLLDGYALVLTRTILVSVLGIHIPWVIIMGNFIFDTMITLCISRYILDRWKALRLVLGLSRSK